MRALLLPVKELNNAKQRLAGILRPQQRKQLAEAMLADTVRAIRESRAAQQVFIATNYEPAMRIAEKYGWEVLREERQTSESDSVDWASRLCESRGVTGLLRLPLDIPLVRGSEIDELLSADCPAPGMIIVPSRGGSGTNALLRTPPCLFPSRFGAGSFAKHLDECERANGQAKILRNARLEMDVDDSSDLQALLACDLGNTETGQWLERAGLLNKSSTAGAQGSRPGSLGQLSAASGRPIRH